MKRKAAESSRPNNDLTIAVGRALRRAARRARETARKYGTPIYARRTQAQRAQGRHRAIMQETHPEDGFA